MRAASGTWIILLFIALTACTGGDGTASIDVEIPDKGAPDTRAPTPTTLPSINEAPRFLLYSQEPVMGPGRGWDRTAVYPGVVFAHDGLLHMFYAGFSGQRPSDLLATVGYAISLDGYEWQGFSDEPFRFMGGMAGDLGFIAVSCVRQEADGLWTMFFSSSWAESGSAISTSSFIGRATAERLEGPWTVDEEHALLPGNQACWDGGGVYSPQVFKTEEGYRMYYVGYDTDVRQFGPVQIGLATSEDGLTWTKHDDPETTGRLYEDSDPVYKTGEEGAFDATSADYPQIMRTQDGWVMLYRGLNREGFNLMSGLGFASSTDGITWERDTTNPILDLDDLLEDSNIVNVVWLFHDGRHLLYLAGRHRSFDVVEIFLAVAE